MIIKQREDRTLIFLHIPKAAGTTLNRIFRRRYRKSDIYMFDGSYEKLDTFKKLPPERRRQIRLLCGHMPFGMHKYLLRLADYITILRDPVDRIVSHYFYVRRKTTHYLHE